MKKIFVSERAPRSVGRALLDFLVKHFTFLGIDLQWWMPIIVGALATYVFWLWCSGQR
jgi:hypothetical protein